MPELPEVETVRQDLANELTGRKITKVTIDGARTVRRHDVEEFLAGVSGRTVSGLRRKGKYLIIDLGQEEALALPWPERPVAGGDQSGIPDRCVIVHLRMSGQLLWFSDDTAPVASHTHCRFTLDSGAEVRFVDPRTFGELWVSSRDAPALAKLGPDALDDVTDWRILAQRLESRRGPLKAVLMNQHVLAGIGNIYADEILFAARLRYDRMVPSLSTPAKKRLYIAVREVLAGAVRARGSSLADKQYRDLYGSVGRAQNDHKVVAKEGRPCPRCDRSILRSEFAGRSTYWCRFCQR